MQRFGADSGSLQSVTRRLDIELTSQRSDDTWTWRAAGARQPKGEVSSGLLPESAAVGALLRAEVDAGLDGMEIVSVIPIRQRDEPADRLELIGRSSAPLVTTKLVSGARRRDSGGSGDARRGGRQDESGRPGARRRPRGGRDDDAREGRADRAERRERGRGKQRDRADATARRRHRDGEEAGAQRRGARPNDRRPDSRKATGRDDRRTGRRDRSSGEVRRKGPLRPKAPSLNAKNVHRDAFLKTLPDEQRAMAREVLRGGIPGLRSTIKRMNGKATAASLPNIPAAPIVTLAESMAPALKAAEWHDRAEAAIEDMDKVDLREIRSVIAAADRSARTSETRALADRLRDGFAARLEEDHRKWLEELAVTVRDGRVIRALRLSSHPPKAGAPLPVDMAERLSDMTATGLSSDTGQQRWANVIDSLAFSPVRSRVIPVSVPDKPGAELLDVVRRHADKLPQIAELFGLPSVSKRRDRPTESPSPPTSPPPHTPAVSTAQAEETRPAGQAETQYGDPEPAAQAATADGDTEPAKPDAPQAQARP